jgi:hypothetical protein
MSEQSSALMLLATLSLSLTACEQLGEPPPSARDASLDSPRAPSSFTPAALTVAGREQPLAFTQAPLVGLVRIESWSPREGERWPPITSKGGDEHGNIWTSDLVVGPHDYWRLTAAGPVAQARDLDPFDVRVPPGPGPARPGRFLGIHGDLLITAVSDRESETRVDIYAALVSAPDEPWHVCALYWPVTAVNGELSVWYQGVGPELAGDQIVLLHDASIVHASILDGVVNTLPLDHRPLNLAVGDGRVAWSSGEDGELRVALDDFTRLFHLPTRGYPRWAGASLIIVNGKRLLRWTEAGVVELELPLPGPDLDSAWFGDGEVLWLFTPGQPLWRIDEDGFVDLDLALEWPVAAIASGGVLIWEVARADRMDVYSTEPGSGLEFDHTLVDMFAAPD